MNDINVTVNLDKTVIIDSIILLEGESSSTRLNVTLPAEYTTYSKYVEYTNTATETPFVTPEIMPGANTFSSYIPHEVLVAGSLLFQIVCKSGTETWKTLPRGILVDESINASELVLSASKDVLKDLSDRMSSLEVGAGFDKNYVHTQSIAADTWYIAHNLYKYPSIVIIDSADSIVIGHIAYVDTCNAIVTFSGGFSGKAICN